MKPEQLAAIRRAIRYLGDLKESDVMPECNEHGECFGCGYSADLDLTLEELKALVVVQQ